MDFITAVVIFGIAILTLCAISVVCATATTVMQNEKRIEYKYKRRLLRYPNVTEQRLRVELDAARRELLLLKAQLEVKDGKATGSTD